uniref:Uncharacterized protein n=1 Tax=Lygus hesperus TaxID=30085 RepID=A0A0K8T085_LYGHE
MYASILTEAYNKFTKESNQTLDAAIRFCAGEIAVQKQQHVLPPAMSPMTATSTSLTSSTAIRTLNLPDNLTITEPQVPAPVPKRGRPPGPGRKVRDPNEPRKPRGRPPNSSLGPRFPNPSQLFGSQSQSSAVPSYMQLQNDLMIRHLKNTSLGAAGPATPLNLPSSLSVTKTSSTSAEAATPLLKDRPSLSITPVTKPLTSSGPRSPSSVSQPPVSSAPKGSKSLSKRSMSPLLSSVTASKAVTTAVSLPKVPSSTQIRPTTSLPPLPLQLFPAHSNPPTLPSSTSLVQKSLPVTLPPTISMPPSSAISISPISPTSQAPKKYNPPGLPLSITPKSPLTTHSYPDIPKTYPAPSPLLHSLPQSVPMQTSHQAVSLQHKLLAKKMNQSKVKSEPPPQIPPALIGKTPRPAHESTYSSHPVTKTASDLIKPSVPSKSSIYNPTPPPAHPSSKFPSNVMKKLPESLLILPTGTARDLDPAPSPHHRLNILSSVANLDQGVQDAIKSFGSSITITAAKSQKAPYSQDASSGSSKKQTKEEGKNSKKVSEVIVLDD